jgi:uncharacterized protein YbjT (DUF2867 family)
MRILLFGASGMVGQGVLREALNAPDVERVVAIVRKPTTMEHPKYGELVRSDFSDFPDAQSEMSGFDACFYCLGVSAGGKSEAEYRRLTYDYALAAATALARWNPSMTFVYVSGAGTDSTGEGRAMWARVKGQTENALLALPFRAAFMFRPAYIHPAHGEQSRTTAYRILYKASGWLFPLLRRLFPRYVTTTEEVGRAMLQVVRSGAPKARLENSDIATLGR